MRNIVITISRQYGSGGKTIGAMLVQDVLCSGRLIIILCHNVSSFSTEKQLFLVDLMVKTS